MAAQQQNRITLGNAALRVKIKIWKTVKILSPLDMKNMKKKNKNKNLSCYYSYIIFLKESKVTDHTDPDKHRGCSQQDAADIIVCQVLQDENSQRCYLSYLFTHKIIPVLAVKYGI